MTPGEKAIPTPGFSPSAAHDPVARRPPARGFAAAQTGEPLIRVACLPLTAGADYSN